MTNGSVHYLRAERLIDKAHKVQKDDPARAEFLMSSAQVHAILAHAHPTASVNEAKIAARALRSAVREINPMRTYTPADLKVFLNAVADLAENEGEHEATGHVYVSTDADGVTSRTRCSCPRGEDHEWDAS